MSKRLRGPLLVSVVLTGALTVTVATADRARDLGVEPGVFPPGPLNAITDEGSCMIVVATDAPVDARDLKRIAARAVFALGRTGSSYGNGSGDFAIAFTTSPEMRSRFGERAPQARSVLQPDGVSPLFQATLEATEEAVYNSMLQAATAARSRRFPSIGSGRSSRSTAAAVDLDHLQRPARSHFATISSTSRAILSFTQA